MTDLDKEAMQIADNIRIAKFKNKVKNHSDEYIKVFEHFKKLFNARYICKGCRKRSDCFQKCLLLPEEYTEIGKERNRFCLRYLKDTDLSEEEQDELIEIFELNIEPDLGKIKIYKD